MILFKASSKETVNTLILKILMHVLTRESNQVFWLWSFSTDK